jgi:hypothetical protein
VKTTRGEARRILRRVYPDTPGLTITSKQRIAVVPLSDPVTPTLVWRAEYKTSPVAQTDDVVFIGRVLTAGQPGQLLIDWSWQP